MSDHAVGGQILVDDLVRGLARGRTEHTFRLVGELELKGLAERVGAYEAAWEPAVGDRAPLPAPLLPITSELPFAGHDAERNALHVQWKSAQTDGRSVALMSGEPGVGKTRLTAGLRAPLHSEGAWVLAGRCDERISAPFTPWLEILRHIGHAHARRAVRRARRRHGGELGRLVPELQRVSPDVPARQARPRDRARLRSSKRTSVCSGTGGRRTMLVVLDDAHSATRQATGCSGTRSSVCHPLSSARRRYLPIGSDIGADHPLFDELADLHREAG